MMYHNVCTMKWFSPFVPLFLYSEGTLTFDA